jgi:hypothetical protein
VMIILFSVHQLSITLWQSPFRTLSLSVNFGHHGKELRMMFHQ